MLPSIFGESLFDDWFDFPFRGFESDVDHKLYGKNAARVMKTDLKDHDDHYTLEVDLPGFKKDQIDWKKTARIRRARSSIRNGMPDP